MPQQDARKSYIGIVNDTAEEERLAGSSERSQPRVVSYLVGRLAAVLKRSGKPAPGRPISSRGGTTTRQTRTDWVTKP